MFDESCSRAALLPEKGHDLVPDLKKQWRDFVGACQDVFFPLVCPCCHGVMAPVDRLLCPSCFSRLQFIGEPHCLCCGEVFSGSGKNHLCGVCLRRRRAFDRARSPFVYEQVVAHLIHSLKYAGHQHGVATLCGLIQQSGVLRELHQPDIIIPVPLHVKRLRSRGFNQALVLAKGVFPDTSDIIRCDVLTRTIDTPSQTGLSGIERRQSLQNAFALARPDEVADKRILLFDDVFTTGATAEECAKVLRKAGARGIEVLTVCRAVKR